MTTRDIQKHFEEIYGAEISATMVSNITEKVVALAEEWQARPLEKAYAYVFFDAIHYKVRDDGKVVTKAAYTVLGVDIMGHKDLLGLWIGENEGAHYWAAVCSELKNRGVEEILIACVDGLKGLPEAIKASFPNTEVQLCVIHQIRNSIRYVGSKYQKEFAADLKLIYKATTKDKAEYELENLEKKWGKKYPIVTNSWRNNWEHLSTFFKFPPDIRRVIYTTNAVEALHRQFRKVTKTRSIFPNDQALTKLLFLAAQDVMKKWSMPLRDWAATVSQLALFYEGRIDLGL